MIELVSAIGFYAMVAMTLNAFSVSVPAATNGGKAQRMTAGLQRHGASDRVENVGEMLSAAKKEKRL